MTSLTYAAQGLILFVILLAIVLVTYVLNKRKSKTYDKVKETILKEYLPLHKARQQKILGYLEKHGRITTLKAAGLLNVSDDTALRELRSLEEGRKIEQKGSGKEIYYVKR